MKAKLYTVKGEKKADVNLPKDYDVKISKSLLEQAVHVFEDGTHFGLHKVKTRAEVNRTKKKLYKQKGTGGARHGARSAPIFVGGGKAHGPKGVKRILSLPLKMKKKALFLALALKFSEGKAILVEGLEKVKKTSEAVKILKALKIKGKVLVVLTKKNIFYKNIKEVKTISFADLNAFEVYKSADILINSSVFEKK